MLSDIRDTHTVIEFRVTISRNTIYKGMFVSYDQFKALITRKSQINYLFANLLCNNSIFIYRRLVFRFQMFFI